MPAARASRFMRQCAASGSPALLVKTKRPATIVLLTQNCAARRGAGADWLFWGHGFRGWSRSKRVLDSRSGVKGYVLHDIRRSVATHMADAGVSLHVVEAVLGHVQGSQVARVYNRAVYENEKRTALALWASHVEGLIGGTRKIIPLPSR